MSSNTDISVEDNWDNYSSYKLKDLVWKKNTSLSESNLIYYVLVKNDNWYIRLNNFPSEPMYTLIVNGTDIKSFNNWPTEWIKPSLFEEIKDVVRKAALLHINDPAIEIYWQEMTSILTKDEQETINLLNNLNDPNEVESISSVFEDISKYFQSKELIGCFEHLQRKFPEIQIAQMIQAARMALNNE